MSRTPVSPVSDNSGYWSARDHSSSLGSFKSWSADENERESEPTEIDLLASEALSMSEEGTSSNVTPTFSDNLETSQSALSRGYLGQYPGASQYHDQVWLSVALASTLCHVGPETPELNDVEVAKQLDFGSEAAVAVTANRQDTPHQAEGAVDCSLGVVEDFSRSLTTPAVHCPIDRDDVAASCVRSASSSSSSSDTFLQSTAASAKPSCRRRPALDSESENDQTPGQSEAGLYQLPSTSAYDFALLSSGHRGVAGTPEAGASFSLNATPPANIAVQRQLSSRSVIVLDSSDEEEEDKMTSCCRNSYLLCRWGR